MPCKCSEHTYTWFKTSEHLPPKRKNVLGACLYGTHWEYEEVYLDDSAFGPVWDKGGFETGAPDYWCIIEPPC